MWIEYNLNFKDEEKSGIHEQGMFNAQHIKWIQIEMHGGGYGKAIEMYYDGYDSKCVFMSSNEEAMIKVWNGLKTALAGSPAVVEGIGYIQPLSRPFLDDTTLIPSAYEQKLPE